MKKNYCFIALLLFAFSINVFAGEDKPSIVVAPFSYVKETVSESDLRRIEAQVEKTINDCKRFDVVNRTDMVVIDKERIKMQGEDFIDGRYIQQGKKIGAEYMVFGRVNSTSCKPDGGKYKNHVAVISLTIKIVDVATTAEIANNPFELNSGKSSGQKTAATKGTSTILDKVMKTNTKDLANDADAAMARTPEQAMTKAIESVEDEMRDFIIEKFPMKFTIAEILEKTDEKVKTILVLAGKPNGVKEKDNLSVIEIIETEVEGKKYLRNVEIAKIEILKFEGDNFSRCAVRTGGVELLAKMNAKARLKAITVQKKF
jgi:Peptidoglycan-synthase activator LpoB